MTKFFAIIKYISKFICQQYQGTKNYAMKTRKYQSERSWKLLVLTLREVSIIKGMNLSEISKTSGINQHTLRRFFTFKFRPTLSTLFLVSCAVGINFFTDKRDNNEDLDEAFRKASKIMTSNDEDDD